MIKEFHRNKYMLEKSEVTIKDGHSRDAGINMQMTQDQNKQDTNPPINRSS